MRLLIRAAAKVTASSQWSTLPESSAEGKYDTYKMYANSIQRKSVLSEKKGDSSETEVNLSEKKVGSVESFYEKILNTLISHLLTLQLRDVFCTEKSWEAFLNEQIKESSFKNRWYVDHMNLMQWQSTVYILNDCIIRMKILHINHDDLWQRGHFN